MSNELPSSACPELRVESRHFPFTFGLRPPPPRAISARALEARLAPGPPPDSPTLRGPPRCLGDDRLPRTPPEQVAAAPRSCGVFT